MAVFPFFYRHLGGMSSFQVFLCSNLAQGLQGVWEVSVATSFSVFSGVPIFFTGSVARFALQCPVLSEENSDFAKAYIQGSWTSRQIGLHLSRVLCLFWDYFPAFYWVLVPVSFLRFRFSYVFPTFQDSTDKMLSKKARSLGQGGWNPPFKGLFGQTISREKMARNVYWDAIFWGTCWAKQHLTWCGAPRIRGPCSAWISDP